MDNLDASDPVHLAFLSHEHIHMFVQNMNELFINTNDFMHISYE